MSSRSWRLIDILEQTSRFFAERELDNARLQAELLLAGVLQLRRLDLYLQFERLLSDAEVGAYRECVRQRLRRIPVQYILGEAGFRELVLAVDARALIPRPETEILVGAALEFVQGRQAPRVLDLGCGSGAIALSLVREHETARVVATDISPEALELARENGARSGADGRVEWLCGDFFAPLRQRPELGPFAAIVSNPPYVRRADLETLEPEVREHEPHLALDGGEDGLDCYRRIVAEAAGFLEEGGALFLEVGQGQAEEVGALLRTSGRFAGAQTLPDLNGVPRVVWARLLPS